MLIQNINANVLKKNEKETSHDKGWGIMEQGAIALVVIIVLALVFGGLYMLRSRQNSLRFSGEAFVHSKT